MSAQTYRLLQICIICCLVFLLGGKALLRHPEWFNGDEHNDRLHANQRQDHISATLGGRFITLGSATSTEDSGFLKHVLPIFQATAGLDVHVEAVGSDRALAMATRGNVDVLLVHDRVGENNLVADGYGIDRLDVMYNDFVIVGPRSDPAGIRGLTDALAAFAHIAAKGAPFVSRGNGGGTYIMERRLWRSAGIEPQGQVWYRKLDEGDGATLIFAASVEAYTLVDRATWENFKNEQRLKTLTDGLLNSYDPKRQRLEILSEGDPVLLNVYSSILVNPAKWPDVKYNSAKEWQHWLTSSSGLEAIKSYRIDGQELFFAPRSRL
jgi:tungstate transport system substrate-binding protein